MPEILFEVILSLVLIISIVVYIHSSEAECNEEANKEEGKEYFPLAISPLDFLAEHCVKIFLLSPECRAHS